MIPEPDPALLDYLVSDEYLAGLRHYDRNHDPARPIPVDEVAEEIRARRFAAADRAEMAREPDGASPAPPAAPATNRIRIPMTPTPEGLAFLGKLVFISRTAAQAAMDAEQATAAIEERMAAAEQSAVEAGIAFAAEQVAALDPVKHTKPRRRRWPWRWPR